MLIVNEGCPQEEGQVLAWRPPPERETISGAQAAGALAGSLVVGALGLLACMAGLIPTL